MNGRFERLLIVKLLDLSGRIFDPALYRCSELAKSALNFWTYTILSKAAVCVCVSLKSIIYTAIPVILPSFITQFFMYAEILNSSGKNIGAGSV